MILDFEKQHIQLRSQQTETKRTKNANKEENKKIKENKQEKAD